MKFATFAFLVCWGVLAFGRAREFAPLPTASYADTEVVTNVPYAAALDVAGRFALTLCCRAMPSNNVEVAFGRDVDGNGTLELEEMDCVLGWDCGAWFVRKGADGDPVRCIDASTNEVKTLVWSVKVGRELRPTALDARADGTAIFVEAVDLSRLYNPAWNMLRLTGRGIDVTGC